MALSPAAMPRLLMFCPFSTELAIRRDTGCEMRNSANPKYGRGGRPGCKKNGEPARDSPSCSRNIAPLDLSSVCADDAVGYVFAIPFLMIANRHSITDLEVDQVRIAIAFDGQGWLVAEGEITRTILALYRHRAGFRTDRHN